MRMTETDGMKLNYKSIRRLVTRERDFERSEECIPGFTNLRVLFLFLIMSLTTRVKIINFPHRIT